MELLTVKKFEQRINEIENEAWSKARERHANEKKTTYFHLFLSPFFAFITALFFRGQLRYGTAGIANAGLQAYGSFQKYAKTILLYKGLS